MTFQRGTFNTISQNSAEFGGSHVVWSRVRELYQGGGYLDLSKYNPGDIIPAGSMVKFNGAGKQVDIITANGNAGAAQVDKLTVTHAATGTGNIRITLNGTNVNIAVASGDTTAQVATKIAAGTFTGWGAVATGSEVVFTKSAVGAVSASVFSDTGTTGVTATFAAVTTGVDADGSDLTDVNGLVFEDVCIPDGATLATCAVVRAGRIYADRVASGGLPTSIESQLPLIEFVRED